MSKDDRVGITKTSYNSTYYGICGNGIPRRFAVNTFTAQQQKGVEAARASDNGFASERRLAS
jgi:hypothetical protein